MDNTAKASPVIALIGFDKSLKDVFNSCNFGEAEVVHFANGMKMTNSWLSSEYHIIAIVSYSEIMAPGGLTLIEALKKKTLPSVPFFLIANHIDNNLRKLALNNGITDVFIMPLKSTLISKRINFSIKNWDKLSADTEASSTAINSIGWGKRLFDIVFSGTALIMLSPLFLTIYILIKFESKGPAFYYSLRVGTGYRIFKFYKFRSMYVNADQRLKDLKHLNQYNGTNEVETEKSSNSLLCAACADSGKCRYTLYADNIQWCEKDFMFSKKANSESAFIKLKNDPRITKVGNFIRNTSIDELPQLWNVLIGNMSIVGNRPLPLYEAEKLTTDKYALRFVAPAGITGLWQVEKRGKGEMSEEERLMLDNVYALNYSFKNDIKLIMKTIPALLQKENV